MPTFEQLQRFRRDFSRLTPEQQRAFLAAVRLFVGGLQANRFAPALRIKRAQGLAGVWELTWAADGRATFHYGQPVREREAHIVWRRVGTHEIFREA